MSKGDNPDEAHAVDHLHVVSGCSGGGKSTLIDELAERGFPVVKEPGRSVVRAQLASGEDGLPWLNMSKFVALCIDSALASYREVQSHDGPVFFDRSIVDSATALSTRGLPMPDRLRDGLANCRYAPRVFMAPPWERLFGQDNERRHTFSQSVEEYEALMREYPAQGYKTVLIPKCSVRERVEFVLRSIGHPEC